MLTYMILLLTVRLPQDINHWFMIFWDDKIAQYKNVAVRNKNIINKF